MAATQPVCTVFSLPDADLRLYTGVWSALEAAQLLTALQTELAWQQKSISLFGRAVQEPRLTCWYGDAGADYRYSGVLNRAIPWPPLLLSIRAKVQEITGASFNAMLGNYYRDGQDSVGWHSDDEPELGPEPIIASVSLGAVRRFKLQHKRDKSRRFSIDLPAGSILLMAGPTQACWRHALPKQARVQAPRINLTFRYVSASWPV